MGHKTLFILFLSLCLIQLPSAFAEEGENDPPMQGEETEDTKPKRESRPQPRNQGTNDAGNSGNAGQMAGTALNTLMGAGMMGYGIYMMTNSETHKGIAVAKDRTPGQTGAPEHAMSAQEKMMAMMMLMMGAQSMAQAAAQMGGAGKSGKSAAGAAYGGYNPDEFTIDLPDGASVTSSELKSQINKGLMTAKKYGITVDPKTGVGTFPDGTKVKPGDISLNAGEMAAATGLPASFLSESFDAFEKSMEKVNAKFRGMRLRATGKGMFGGGGGGGRSSGEGPGYDASIQTPKFAFNLKGKKKRGLAGKFAKRKSMFKGSPIGVAGDNIFDMVTRKYKSLVTRSYFANYK